MPRYFLDSSALVKRYHPEVGTSFVESLFDQATNRFLISRLAIVELHSCFARLIRGQVLTEEIFRELIAQLNGDIVARRLTVAAISEVRLNGACAVLAATGLKHSLRTLDAIQLATALAAHGRSRLTAFVAADKQLLATAAVWGLPIIEAI
jgi:uncharacterized protein